MLSGIGAPLDAAHAQSHFRLIGAYFRHNLRVRSIEYRTPCDGFSRLPAPPSSNKKGTRRFIPRSPSTVDRARHHPRRQEAHQHHLLRPSISPCGSTIGADPDVPSPTWNLPAISTGHRVHLVMPPTFLTNESTTRKCGVENIRPIAGGVERIHQIAAL